MSRILAWPGWVAVWTALIIGLGPANVDAQTRPNRLVLSLAVNGEQVTAGEAVAVAGDLVTVALVTWLDVRSPEGANCGGRSVAIAHAPVGEGEYPAMADPYVIGERWDRYGGLTLQWRPTPGEWTVEVRTLVLCDWPADLRLTTDHPVWDDGRRFDEGTAFVIVAPVKVVAR